jgi:predicted acyltransferase
MKNRLLSVDVIRGLTIALMIIVNTPGSWSYVYAPLKHASWHGCTPTDLVFPFFLFISGVSFFLSYQKNQTKPQSEILKKIWKRAALIFLVGLLLNWFPFYHQHISDLRIMGVLQRIACAYAIGASLAVLLSKKGLMLASSLILVVYNIVLWMAGNDPYSLEHNLTRTIDLAILGESHVYGGFGIPFDPEGIIHSFPAAINVTIGFLVGWLITSRKGMKKVTQLGIAAAFLIGGGLLWGLFFPINKPLWTSSYALYTTGLGSLLLAAAIWVIDVRLWKKWTLPFRVFGMNPLFSYVLSILIVKILLRSKIGDTSTYGYLYREGFAPIFGDYFGSFMFALTYTTVIWCMAYWLYLKKIIIKL